MSKPTRYFLAGGSDRAYEQYGLKLSAAINESIANPKILSCFFSQDESLWDEKFIGWGEWFKKYLGQDIEYKLATVNDFLQQVKWADIVYLHGGTTILLQTALQQFNNLEETFKEKIIIGSSAGTNYLSKTFFSPKRNVVGLGSGIIDINTIVHYGATSDGEVSLSKDEWLKVIKRMKESVGDESIILLPEGEFISIVK